MHHFFVANQKTKLKPKRKQLWDNIQQSFENPLNMAVVLHKVLSKFN